jgi:hypothetical protein
MSKPIFRQSITIAVIPLHRHALGFPDFAWRSLSKGRDSAVQIGVLLNDRSINWEWSD